ncbi:M20/M25/M40 family metallo-hydrolase [Kordiimonas marina]|uniref:M20/M25/M40 family metallo-hydrolase n=1 Tax=Kordiimonas marina TaxID=2872312 RepID=UPI001FF34A32|nr:M20/M25/M40 family metallo-hydrolase [Kordiimonas marina]MCJ9429002.1 M20/M25/M40 family metallo-hydrolase [Kordiimonas marina]
MNPFSFAKAAVSAALVLSSISISAAQPPLDPQAVEMAAKLRDAALKSDTAYSLLEELTTKFGPRLSGSKHERAAIDWAEAKLKAMGFDKVWTEPVTVDHWERIKQTASIISPYAQPVLITALGHSVSTPKGGLTADVVQFDTLADLKAADPAKVKGKIAFISNRMERAKDGSGYGPAVQARAHGAAEGARKGALAVVIRSIGTDTHRLPHDGIQRYEDGVKKIPAAALSNPDADQLMRILKEGKPVKLHLDIQTKDYGKVQTANVIAEITGRETPDQAVVIGGHIDSWDHGTGAIDDGAGVALTVAAAKMIKDMAPQHPRKTIRVILWASEEPGLLGAKAYVAAHKDELKNIAIEAESDFGADNIYGLRAAVSEDSLHVIDAMARVLGPIGVTRRGGKVEGGSDQSLLKDAGVPAVDLMQDGTRYFDLHHTADDTLDKVDPAQLQQNLACWVVFTYLSAEWGGSFR